MMNRKKEFYLNMAGLFIKIESDWEMSLVDKMQNYFIPVKKNIVTESEKKDDIVSGKEQDGEFIRTFGKEQNKKFNEEFDKESNEGHNRKPENNFDEKINSEPDVIYHIKLDNFDIPKEAKQIHNNTDMSVYSDATYYYTIFPIADIYVNTKIMLKRKIEFEKDYYIYVRPNDKDYILNDFKIYAYMAFEEVLVHHNGIVLHSSSVKWNDSAILFSASSGVGKSTQAALWEKYENATVINGDKTVIRKIEDKYVGFGSMFAGSSGIYTNESAPVKAIVLLSQYKENVIKRVNSAEVFKRLYKETASNLWNSSFSFKVVEFLGEMLINVPVYEFKCRPDREAVEIVKSEVSSVF